LKEKRIHLYVSQAKEGRDERLKSDLISVRWGKNDHSVPLGGRESILPTFEEEGRIQLEEGREKAILLQLLQGKKTRVTLQRGRGSLLVVHVGKGKKKEMRETQALISTIGGKLIVNATANWREK